MKKKIFWSGTALGLCFAGSVAGGALALDAPPSAAAGATYTVRGDVAAAIHSAAQVLRTGAVDKAVGLYTAVVNTPLEGERGRARLGLAAALSQQGRLHEALHALEGTVTDESPLGKAVGTLRGELMLKLGDAAWWTEGEDGLAAWLAQYDRLTLQPDPAFAERLRGRLTPALSVDDPLRVGVLVPQSGPLAAVGEEILRGLALGLADAKAQGGQNVVMTVYDTAAAGGATAAAQAAIDGGAAVLVGPVRAGNVAAVAGLAEAAGVPILHFSTDNDAKAPGQWSVVPGPDAQAAAAYGALVAQGVSGSVAALVPDTAYGRTALAGLQNAARRQGKDVRTAFYNPAVADVGSGIRTLLHDKPAMDSGLGGLLLPIPAKDVPLIASQLAYADLDKAGVTLLGTALWQDGLLLGNEGAVLRGALMGVPGQVPAFDEAYAQAYGRKASPMAAVAADTARVLALLAHRKAREAGLDLRTALTEPEGFYGAQGYFRFGVQGGTRRGMAVSRLDAGVFHVVQPALVLPPLPLPDDLEPKDNGRGWFQ